MKTSKAHLENKLARAQERAGGWRNGGVVQRNLSWHGSRQESSLQPSSENLGSECACSAQASEGTVFEATLCGAGQEIKAGTSWLPLLPHGAASHRAREQRLMCR